MRPQAACRVRAHRHPPGATRPVAKRRHLIVKGRFSFESAPCGFRDPGRKPILGWEVYVATGDVHYLGHEDAPLLDVEPDAGTVLEIPYAHLDVRQLVVTYVPEIDWEIYE